MKKAVLCLLAVLLLCGCGSLSLSQPKPTPKPTPTPLDWDWRATWDWYTPLPSDQWDLGEETADLSLPEPVSEPLAEPEPIPESTPASTYIRSTTTDEDIIVYLSEKVYNNDSDAYKNRNGHMVYHYSATCGMDHSYPITLAEAKQRGLDPCERCG